MTRPRLSVTELTLGAYQTLWDNFRTYLRLAWAPFILCGILGVLVIQISSPQIRVIASLLFSIVFFLLLVPVVTAWHRLILLGPEHKNSRVAYSFSKEEWFYVLAIIVLHVAYFLMAVIFGFLVGPLVYGVIKIIPHVFFESLDVNTELFGGYAVGFVVGFLTFLCLVRFLLVLPAAAIGEKMRISDSGRATEGNTWKLFFSYGVSWLPLLYIQIFHTSTLYNIVAGTRTGVFGDPELDVVVAIIPEFLFYTISVAVLSFSYKALVLNRK